MAVIVPVNLELSNDVKQMVKLWEASKRALPLDSKALLDLALRCERRVSLELASFAERGILNTKDVAKITFSFAHMLFESHSMRAEQLYDEKSYGDALEHAGRATALSEAHEGAWAKDVVAHVLECEKSIWSARGEQHRYLETARRQVRILKAAGMTSGETMVYSLADVATVQIELRDVAGAIASAREAVGVDAPFGPRTYARMKLGVALLRGERYHDALRELERCDARAWDGSDMGPRLARALAHNLRMARNLVAQEDGDVLGRAMSQMELSVAMAESASDDQASPTTVSCLSLDLLRGGDLEGAAKQAERALELLSRESTSQAQMLLPGLEARAFSMANCMLRDDHRAAVHLEAMRAALGSSHRRLEDACTICLQPLAWPVRLEKGARVEIRGLKRAADLNGARAVVVRVPRGADCRAAVRIDGTERIVSVRSSNLAADGTPDPSERVYVTFCTHAFHAKCIKQAVKNEVAACPVCRESTAFTGTLCECACMPAWK
mmetsp:Transcript_30138/g.102423  ORF Transcript_30138/g.102423 Transcript_30138/m.102423 type:complete len:498 (-) Transcript_30138:18-1511(-)